MKKSIIFVLIGNLIHGGNSRYLKIFNYLNNKKSDKYRFYLYINSALFNLFKNKKYIISSNNIVILRNGNEFLNKESVFFKVLNNSYISRVLFFFQIVLKTFKIKNKIYHLGPGGVMISDFIKFFLKAPVICSAFHSGENALKTIRTFYKKADIIETHTPSLFDKIKKDGFNNIYLSPGTFYNFTQNKNHNFNTQKHIVFSGRLENSKNVNIFLKTAVKYNELFPESNVKFIILGDGSLKEKVIDFEKKYKNIKYYGFVDNTYDYLIKSSIFYCLQKDKISQSLTEAMLAGNLVLMSKEGDYKTFNTKGIFIVKDIHNINNICNIINNIFKLEKIEFQNLRKENMNFIEKIVNPVNYISFFESLWDNF
ncbi:MAG: glycosyltransferase [Candidatus Muirbacterium halophilum]|nr:glycosyltransferase [Candidatus Muirbacterium halophilum]MCK9476614.1 glycosyltransferase [Candidatus Muirbacterium halophilum]